MILLRHGNGEAALVQDEREIVRISAQAAEGPAYEALLDGIEAALCRNTPPRVAVTYREGLFANACSETAVDLVLIEEDPHDSPPRQVRRQRALAEPALVEALLAGLDGNPSGGAMKR
jgi:hypothetical protein